MAANVISEANIFFRWRASVFVGVREARVVRGACVLAQGVGKLCRQLLRGPPSLDQQLAMSLFEFLGLTCAFYNNTIIENTPVSPFEGPHIATARPQSLVEFFGTLIPSFQSEIDISSTVSQGPGER